MKNGITHNLRYKKMTQAQDDAYDKKHGIKEGSKRDIAQDRRNGIKDKKRKAINTMVAPSKMNYRKPNFVNANNPQSRVLGGKALQGSGMKLNLKKRKAIKTSGKFHGKSNTLGHGGRAAQLRAQGVPGGVIGNLARAAHAAPGQANFHGKKRKKTLMSKMKRFKQGSGQRMKLFKASFKSK